MSAAAWTPAQIVAVEHELEIAGHEPDCPVCTQAREIVDQWGYPSVFGCAVPDLERAKRKYWLEKTMAAAERDR